MNLPSRPPPSAPHSPLPAPRIESFALFLLLFALAMAAWSGRAHTSDGLAMVTVSDSLARYGRWDIEGIRWLGLQQGSFGPDGLLYSRKGLATSLLALPLAWVGLRLPDIGPIHAALLLTPLLHALTGLYLYHLCRRVQPAIGRGGALAVVCLWAFGSMALAYVKTFFSEPAVALALVAALFHLARFRDRGAWRDVAAVGGWLGLGLLTRSANAIVLPLYAAALLVFGFRLRNTLARRHARRGWRGWLRDPWAWQRVAAFALPVLASVAITLWYNALRFGNPFDSGYLPSENFGAVWWQGIVGQTVSPGRGLLWYTPWLPLAGVGAWRGWPRGRAVPLVALGCALVYLLFYGKWYLWSGGFGWGPRFLVPVLPLLALLVAPLLVPDARRWWPAVWALGALGLAVNGIGTLWDIGPHQAALEATGLPLFAPETFFDPQHAQIPGVLRLGLNDPASLDVAWMVEGRPQPRVLALTVAIALAGAGAGAWGWRKGQGRSLLAVGAMIVVASLWLLLGDLRAFQNPSLQDALAQLPEPLPPDAQLWLDDPTASETLLNQLRAPLPVLGLNVGGSEFPPDDEVRTIAAALAARGPVFLLSDGPGRDSNAVDLTLRRFAFPLEQTTLGRYRMATYWKGPLGEATPYGLRLAFPDGAAVRLREARLTAEVPPGGVLAVQAVWEALTPLPEDYQVFVHLTNEAGETVAQRDGPPAQGLRPPSTWQPGQPIVDRHALRLPATLPPGSYTLRFGLYRLRDLARAASDDGQNEVAVPVRVR